MHTTTGINYELTLSANQYIFIEVSKSSLKAPKPPLWYNEQTDRWMDNEFHPLYKDSLMVYDVARHDEVWNAILKICVKLPKFDYEQYRLQYSTISTLDIDNLDIKTWVKKYFIFTSPLDQQYITRNALLCESRVHAIFSSIRVTRGGQDINSVNIKHAIQTGINTDAIVIAGEQLVSPLDEIKACRFAHMDWQHWLNGKYTLDEKASAIALHRLDNTVETHQNDAVQIYQEAQSKKGNK